MSCLVTSLEVDDFAARPPGEFLWATPRTTPTRTARADPRSRGNEERDRARVVQACDQLPEASMLVEGRRGLAGLEGVSREAIDSAAQAQPGRSTSAEASRRSTGRTDCRASRAVGGRFGAVGNRAESAQSPACSHVPATRRRRPKGAAGRTSHEAELARHILRGSRSAGCPDGAVRPAGRCGPARFRSSSREVVRGKALAPGALDVGPAVGVAGHVAGRSRSSSARGPGARPGDQDARHITDAGMEDGTGRRHSPALRPRATTPWRVRQATTAGRFSGRDPRSLTGRRPLALDAPGDCCVRDRSATRSHPQLDERRVPTVTDDRFHRHRRTVQTDRDR